MSNIYIDESLEIYNDLLKTKNNDQILKHCNEKVEEYTQLLQLTLFTRQLAQIEKDRELKLKKIRSYVKIDYEPSYKEKDIFIPAYFMMSLVEPDGTINRFWKKDSLYDLIEILMNENFDNLWYRR